MKVSTEIDNNFGYEKITQLVDNIPLNRISELIVSMLAFHAGDWGWFTVGSNLWGQTKEFKIGVCCFFSINVASRVSIIYPNWVTCLPANCYFSVLALYKFGSACPSKTECISIASNIACSCHDIPEKLLTWHQETIISPPF